MNRILWNVRDEEIDELVVHNCTVHIEQMSDSCWWIGIDAADGGHWAGNVYSATGRARITFTEQENEDFIWVRDEAHEEPS